MANKKSNKTIIRGINPYQRALLEVDPSTDRYVYMVTPNDVLDLELGEPPISKPDYVKLYGSWSDNDKYHLNILTSFLNNDVEFKFKGGKDDNGEFGEFSVENNTEKYIIKIYGPVKFLAFFQIQFIKGTLFKPGFTIDSLYQEALKQD
jgi:hypothetical protein